MGLRSAIGASSIVEWLNKRGGASGGASLHILHFRGKTCTLSPDLGLVQYFLPEDSMIDYSGHGRIHSLCTTAFYFMEQIMLRIYGSAKSRASRVLWMAGELGLAYDHKDWLPRSAETKTPDYRALNPNGRVPTIDDDGFVLSESMAINFYLAKKHGGGLYPADPKNEALAWQWSLWETDRIDRQLVNHARNTKDLPEAERNAEVARAAWAELLESFDVLESALAKSPFLAGPAFSVGDLNVASALYRALLLDLGKWPHLQAWLNGCWARPAAKKVRAMRE